MLVSTIGDRESGLVFHIRIMRYSDSLATPFITTHIILQNNAFYIYIYIYTKSGVCIVSVVTLLPLISLVSMLSLVPMLSLLPLVSLLPMVFLVPLVSLLSLVTVKYPQM